MMKRNHMEAAHKAHAVDGGRVPRFQFERQRPSATDAHRWANMMKATLILLATGLLGSGALAETGLLGEPDPSAILMITIQREATIYSFGASSKDGKALSYGFSMGKERRSISRQEFMHAYSLASKSIRDFQRSKPVMPEPGHGGLQSVWIASGADQAQIMFDNRAFEENPALVRLMEHLKTIEQQPAQQADPSKR
jgi:hypothetical protein